MVVAISASIIKIKRNNVMLISSVNIQVVGTSQSRE